MWREENKKKKKKKKRHKRLKRQLLQTTASHPRKYSKIRFTTRYGTKK